MRSSLSTRLSSGRVPRMTSDNFTCNHTKKERGDLDFCLSRYTDTNPTIREQGSNPRPPDHASCALQTCLPHLASLGLTSLLIYLTLTSNLAFKKLGYN